MKNKKIKRLQTKEEKKFQERYVRNLLIATGMIVALLLITLFVFSKKPASPIAFTTTTQSNEMQFLYPSQNQTLVKGETYRIKWVGGPKHIDALYLVDTALEKDGVSISLADRIYNFTNEGYFDYTVPSYLPNGEYLFEIGDNKSNTFKIVSPN